MLIMEEQENDQKGSVPRGAFIYMWGGVSLKQLFGVPGSPFSLRLFL